MRADSSLSVGVLTRTNRAVAEVIYLLEQRGLDVSQEGGNPLTDSAAVEVVLSALMMAEHRVTVAGSFMFLVLLSKD